jgi:hypothetical protein
MDGQRFDRMARILAGGVSRRAVLRGAAAGLAGAVGLRVSRAGAGQEKKPLCHATGDPAQPWVVIDIAEPAWQTHFDHGDHDFVDCCADADCTGEGQTCGGGGVAGQCGSCTPPHVRLANGSCALPCTTDDECAFCGGVCDTIAEGGPNHLSQVCLSGDLAGFCPALTSSECPVGFGCRFNGENTNCGSLC